MKPTLGDSDILLDVAASAPTWSVWSSQTLQAAANESPLAISTLTYADVPIGYERIEDLEQAIPSATFRREPLPYEAAFLAGKAFLKYRRRGGQRTSPLPDFFIGAHAAVSDFRILTRDSQRYRTYFPTVELISPE